MKQSILFSTHESHVNLATYRNGFGEYERQFIINFGNTCYKPDTKGSIYINHPKRVEVFKDKIRMKQVFVAAGVSTPAWKTVDGTVPQLEPNMLPVIFKKQYGEQGNGKYFCDTADLIPIDKGKGYIEKYYGRKREFRMHVSIFGCFYVVQKILLPEKREVVIPKFNDHEKWTETFDRPDWFGDCAASCVRALEQANLHFAAFDVIESHYGDWYVLEGNTGMWMDKPTRNAYRKEVPVLIKKRMQTL